MMMLCQRERDVSAAHTLLSQAVPCCSDLGIRMEEDEEFMDDPVFPSQNVQRIVLRVSHVNLTGL